MLQYVGEAGNVCNAGYGIFYSVHIEAVASMHAVNHPNMHTDPVSLKANRTTAQAPHSVDDCAALSLIHI